jgi:hypothetical protein
VYIGAAVLQKRDWKRLYDILLELSLGCLTMKMQKKSDLPTKICAVCGRPFTWRKKWEKNWDEVKYCSDACRGKKQSVQTEKARPA